MKRAVELSEKGRLTAPPNPWVGCVIVGETGKILGEGFHLQAGQAHAEVEALQDARGRGNHHLRGATVFVTLEPCHHIGRTGPCDRALIEAGVARVVIGVLDPDERVAGQGVQTLKAAGIRVDVGVCEASVRASLGPYLHQRRTRRPWVVAKAAVSLDGRIACADSSSQWITGETARAHAHSQYRATSQAILVGAQTVLDDNPSLTVRGPSASELRAQPVRVVLDPSGRCTGAHLRVLNGSHPTWIFTTTKVPLAARETWSKCENVTVFDVPAAARGGRGLDLSSVVRELATRGVIQVLVEGGATLHAAFVREELVDELALYYGACLIGGSGAPWLAAPLASTMGEVLRNFALRTVVRLGDSDFVATLTATPPSPLRTANQPVRVGVAPIVGPLPPARDAVPRAVLALQKGLPVVVMDDETRENEGDLIFAAQFATPALTAFMIRHTGGVLCVSMSADRAKHLNLPPMINSNECPKGTGYTVSCDAKHGTTTGISAQDRSTTFCVLAAPETQAEELIRPGHVFPLIAREGGVLVRRGHTEGSVDLCKLAGVQAVAVIGELMKPSGDMMRFPDCLEFAKTHNLEIVTIEQIAQFLQLPADQQRILPLAEREVEGCPENAKSNSGAEQKGNSTASSSNANANPNSEDQESVAQDFSSTSTSQGQEDSGAHGHTKEIPMAIPRLPQETTGAMRIGLVSTMWNRSLVGPLEKGCKEAVLQCGVPNAQIVMLQVPGSFELPFAVAKLIRERKVDAVVALGLLIKGETAHFEYISSSCSSALAKISVDMDTPVIYGVLNCFTVKQAEYRCLSPSELPASLGLTAVRMAALKLGVSENF